MFVRTPAQNLRRRRRLWGTTCNSCLRCLSRCSPEASCGATAPCATSLCLTSSFDRRRPHSNSSRGLPQVSAAARTPTGWVRSITSTWTSRTTMCGNGGRRTTHKSTLSHEDGSWRRVRKKRQTRTASRRRKRRCRQHRKPLLVVVFRSPYFSRKKGSVSRTPVSGSHRGINRSHNSRSSNRSSNSTSNRLRLLPIGPLWIVGQQTPELTPTRVPHKQHSRHQTGVPLAPTRNPLLSKWLSPTENTFEWPKCDFQRRKNKTRKERTLCDRFIRYTRITHQIVTSNIYCENFSAQLTCIIMIIRLMLAYLIQMW